VANILDSAGTASVDRGRSPRCDGAVTTVTKPYLCHYIGI